GLCCVRSAGYQALRPPCQDNGIARERGREYADGMMELSYRRHRFPPVVIQHAVWLYLRFTLSYRDIEDLLAERGPGRDLRYFRSLGHDVVGLDGSTEFVAMARSYSECEVLRQDFLAVKLPESRFDRIFANASLFHVASQELPSVLVELSSPGYTRMAR